jgi:hypothetical protein
MAFLHLGIRLRAKLRCTPGTSIFADTTGIFAYASLLVYYYNAISLTLLDSIYRTNR